MNLIALPAFADNYIWMLHDGQRALVVDPGDESPVIAALSANSLQLAAILVTHHHPDHVGGVDALRPLLDGPVFGPAGESIPEPYMPQADGDRIEVLGLRFAVLTLPGHTAGHIAYVQQGATQAPWLFCGDTLFSAGCGRLFEGTPAQMFDSLARLAALPADTQVCCTHEYTLSNLRFANAVEPDNAALQAYTEACTQTRAAGASTLPSRIGLERDINPFLRCDQPAVIEAALAHGARDRSGPEVFAALRRWKDKF